MNYEGLYEHNYANDPRNRADEDRWWDMIDDAKMRARLLDDGEGGWRTWVPIRWALCTLCSGKGVVVNPSIDCGGLTAEDFWEEEGFRGDYLSGLYDIDCPLCSGRRVMPERIEGRVSLEG
jgi:DNA-directed RNA polymerase subunit RPC12/RpoP